MGGGGRVLQPLFLSSFVRWPHSCTFLDHWTFNLSEDRRGTDRSKLPLIACLSTNVRSARKFESRSLPFNFHEFHYWLFPYTLKGVFRCQIHEWRIHFAAGLTALLYSIDEIIVHHEVYKYWNVTFIWNSILIPHNLIFIIYPAGYHKLVLYKPQCGGKKKTRTVWLPKEREKNMFPLCLCKFCSGIDMIVKNMYIISAIIESRNEQPLQEFIRER